MAQLYVIILDLDVPNKKFWTYVAIKDTSADIKKVNNYSSTNRTSLSKKKYQGDVVQDSITLTCTDDYSTATGKIYLLTKITI